MNDEIVFDERTCQMFADIIKQDVANVKVLFYIAQCTKESVPVTVKTITENVQVERKMGVKDKRNNLVAFDKQTAHIDRKTAERIVDRLAYASLIYYELQHPHKFIRLTQRGIQVAIRIKQYSG